MPVDSLTYTGEICTYLQSLGGAITTPLIYTSSGTQNLFAGVMPDVGSTVYPVPDLCVAIMQRPGLQPLGVLTGTTGNSGTLKFTRPQIQILTRAGAQQYQVGYDLSESIMGALHGISDTVLNSGGALFHSIWAVQSLPAYLGQTAGRERHLWSQTFDAFWEDPALA